MAYDLTRLYINFENCPEDVRLSDFHPDLSAYEEFRECPDDNYIKLAILTADEGSPLMTIKDRGIMIAEAFKIINLKVDLNRSLFESIVDYNNIHYMNAWLKYLYIQNEVMFTDWLLSNRDYEYFLKLAKEPKREDESDDSYIKRRKSIRATITSLGEEKSELEAKLFPDSKAARQAAMNEQKKKIKLYAEQYAEPFSYF